MHLKIKDEYADQLKLCFARPDSLVELVCSLCRRAIDDDAVPTQFWDDAGGAITLCDHCAGQVVEVNE